MIQFSYHRIIALHTSSKLPSLLLQYHAYILMADPLNTLATNIALLPHEEGASSPDVSPMSWPSPQAATNRKSQRNSPYSNDEANIFERSLSTPSFGMPSRRSSKSWSSSKANGRHASIVSVDCPKLFAAHHSAEDFIPPVLDHTTEILSDPLIDLDDVNVVCCECDGQVAKSKEQHNSRRCSHSEKHSSDSHGARPILRSRSRSRSLICNSLLSALASSDDEEEEQLPKDDEESVVEPLSDPKTINFYSFNDILSREKDLERFNTFRMSKLLS